MGIPDSSFLDLFGKVRSWISWGGNDLSGDSREYWIDPNSSCKMCWECETHFTEFSFKCQYQRCGRVLCGKCMLGTSASVVAPDGCRNTTGVEEHICKFCFLDGTGNDDGGDYRERIEPFPRQNPEHELPGFDREKFNDNNNNNNNNDNIKPFQSDHLARFLEAQRHGSSPRAVASSSSSTGRPSSVSFRRSSSRSDDEDAEDSGKHYFSPSSVFCHDVSDIDSCSISTRNDFYSFRSVGSSPLDSPSGMTSTPTRARYLIQQEQEGSPGSQKDSPFDKDTTTILRNRYMENADLGNTDECSDDQSVLRGQCEKVQQPLDFENNGLIWFPPPPDGEEDPESDVFRYDDDDDDIGGSGMMVSSSNFSTDTNLLQEKSGEEEKEPLRAVVHGHFRALVSQLLQGEGIWAGNDSGGEDWLDIVASIAWQAANFVKPDTSRGGSMDPGDYVKVKCIVSGSPNESTLIKGVVCTKNIKHKRMTSQYRSPRLLLLGGSIEYQRSSNQLASFDTLLQQEIDHLKMIVSKIEAHRPNVLLVEKCVSSYAQEYLLAKEISLVLNVKRPLLERISRCTGALIVPSVDTLSAVQLGHCEVFRLERVFEDCAFPGQPNKKSAKTLMFFEGCPRRIGCTVLLKGASREILKKVKHVVQYAVFAAYHLSLETSFLADEGASLPKIPPVTIPERMMVPDSAISVISNSSVPNVGLTVTCKSQDLGKCSMPSTSSVQLASVDPVPKDRNMSNKSDLGNWKSSGVHNNPDHATALSPRMMETGVGTCSDASNADLLLHVTPEPYFRQQFKEWTRFSVIPSEDDLESSGQEGRTSINPWQSAEVQELTKTDRIDWNDASSEYFSTVDNHQSILVSLSSRCVLKGTVCERSQLLRIKFYGSFDKPLGRYLRGDLFDQTSSCRSCKEPADAHVQCYTHQQGSLSINVKRLPSPELPELPGVRDGKIWMWHRCLKCTHKDGVPPATRRVVMSDAAWGLSFGKFLELSFSNHATANRVASCGHSLQRDCLRYYGFGSMVAYFRYSSIDILSVRLPPSILEFNGQVQLEWVKKEAVELSIKMEDLYGEVFGVLHNIERKGTYVGPKHSDANEFHNHIADLKDLLKKERNEYEDLLQPVGVEDSRPVHTVDILELNRVRRCLLIDSYFWDRRLYALDSLLKSTNSVPKVNSSVLDTATYIKLKEWRDESFSKDNKLSCSDENNLKLEDEPHVLLFDHISDEQSSPKSEKSFCLEELELSTDYHKHDELDIDSEVLASKTSLESLPSPASSLSDKIDSAWTGKGQLPLKDQVHLPQQNGKQTGLVGVANQLENPSRRRLMAPVRVYSFDSAVRIQEKISKGLSPAALHLSSLRSFHASGDYQSMVRDPIPNMLRTFSQTSISETQKLNFIFSSAPSFISSVSQMAGEGVRLLLPQTGHSNIVIPVYDNEPTSVISYALGSKEYEDWIANRSGVHEGAWNASVSNKDGSLGNLSGNHHSAASFSVWQSGSPLDSDDLLCRNYGADDASSTISSLFSEPKISPHARVSFGDESSSAGKVKFSVICYFARQFDALRKSCCPSEVDFIRSLSRGKRWSAQGGKSNVYFAKSLDDRFIIKQITKTELDSFEEFAPEYFKYLMDSLNSGSPTCLAKVLGIYQVNVKHLKGGRETKIDLVVMENLFYNRNVSRVYDLKGSTRSRYNADTTGKDKVMLDMNLLETLHTNPIFLGSKAKRSLERAVWNDTSFLASVDVMDYSLLVGVDDDNKELVLGIIDFMRQYTWDKHLETWVKASGILGGPKNAPPTVISPKQYKKRFRKAMSTYFLTVPDQWSS